MTAREWFDFQLAMCYLRMAWVLEVFSLDAAAWCVHRGDRLRDKYLCAEEDL